MDRSFRRNINKAIIALNDTSDKKYLIDIFRTFYAKAAKYTFLKDTRGIF